MRRFLFCAMLFLFIAGISINLSAQDVTILYKCAQTEEIINKIKPYLKVVNNSAASIAMSELTIRYWFTAEGYVTSILSIDYAQIGSSNIQGVFYDGYLEIKFTTGAGSIPAGGDSGEVQLRIEKSSHGNYIQTDDYSYQPALIDYTANNRIACYRNGTLIYGSEPPAPPDPTAPPDPANDWLHTDGPNIKDASGNTVRLTGINWYGFETNPLGLGGLQAVNWQYGFQLLTGRGFNTLRLPISLEIITGWKNGTDPLVQFVSGTINPDIDGVSSLVLLDKVVDYCKVVGMKIILDMHCLNTNNRTALWYNTSYTIASLKTGWQWIVSRYKNDDTIIGADLFNEPHGQGWVDGINGAKWDGSGDANNWRSASAEIASAVLAANPNLLIFVEGVESYPIEGKTYSSTLNTDYYCNWWGGNLRGVASYPVNLGSYQNKLVYSPHDYGPDLYVQPWFAHAFDITSLTAECWQPNWYYITEAGTAPIHIGEWGGKLENVDNKAWLTALSTFISQKNLNHTFWCFNPDSGDTGGIVTTDWNTVDEVKYTIVKPSLWKDGSGKFIGLDHEVVLGLNNTGTNVTLYYGGVIPTPAPTDALTTEPSQAPTTAPTENTTAAPTDETTPEPTTVDNTPAPTDTPTDTPAPTETPAPTAVPTATPAGATADPTTPATVTPEPTTPASETSVPTIPPADTAAPTESPTTPPAETTSPTGCTCTNLCSSQTAFTVPLTYDGAGEYCWTSSSLGSYVNSWNTDAVNVNGTNCTNTYTSSSSISAINGVYYVYYKASYSWSHIEIK